MLTPAFPKTRLALALLAACFAGTAQGALLTLDSDKDTSLFKNNPNNSLGGGPALFAGTNQNNFIQRGLISFDLSSVPTGSTITGVRLTLTLGQAAANGPGTATIGLFDVTRLWGEGTNGSTSAGIAGTGNGFAAGPGDATWNAAAFGSTLWTAAGGDRALTASASLLLSGTTPGTAFTWLSTPELVADVQGWVNAPGTNFGWEVINANESTANSQYAFYTREWDNAHFGGASSQVPALEVTYSVPEPAAGALLAAAAVGLTWRRRHARTA